MNPTAFIPPEPDETLRRMPKVNLHSHLEGSIRPETFLELASAQHLALPFDPAEVRDRVQVNGSEKNLLDYLAKIMVNYPVLKNAEALRRTAFEAAEDAHRDGVIYFELRAGPALHARPGMTMGECIASMSAGLAEAQERYGIVCGQIVAGLRNHDLALNEELARAAVRFKERGVVGFDLAGDEAGYPAALHRRAYEIAREGRLGLTVHAGEAAGAENVRYAVVELGARRIGHGVRSAESMEVMDLLRDEGVLLEVCPTSNVHTGAAPSIEAHPVRRLAEHGIRISINDDDPITSRTRVSNELALLRSVFGFTMDELITIQLMALEGSFLRDDVVRARLRERIGAFRAS